jgi:hypothetical protein
MAYSMQIKIAVGILDRLERCPRRGHHLIPFRIAIVPISTKKQRQGYRYNCPLEVSDNYDHHKYRKSDRPNPSNEEGFFFELPFCVAGVAPVN